MICCAALGGAIGVCLAFVAEHLADEYEHILIREEMEAELDTQIDLHRHRDDDDTLARTAWRSVYIDRPGEAPTSPVKLRGLAPGVHELSDDAQDRFAGIREAKIGRVTIVAGLPDSPARERRFAEELAAMIGLGILLGGWLGRMLAGSMLAPVLRLSHEVERADPRDELHGIADDHRSDEVGALANAFLHYQGRVNAAIEREVLFSADAGHELRTPLTVLQGAMDLLDAQIMQAPLRRKLDRMRRSATEIGMLLDALLLLARPEERVSQAMPAIELTNALASAIAEFREPLENAGIEVGVRCAPEARLHAPADLVKAILRLLLRTLASGAWGEHLLLDADATGFRVSLAASTAALPGSDAGEEATARDTPHAAHSSTPRRSDETGSIGMLRRLCERYGWSLDVPVESPSRCLLIVRTPAPPAADPPA